MPGALDYLKQRLAELDEQGLLLQPRTLEGPTGARARFDGRDVINLASNNYLGLANHPRMNAAAAKAASELGAGTGAVRTIAGSMTMHRELERRFAAFKHAEDALMFQSGFTANAGTVAAILDKQDVIVSDRLNHASIIDGARLSRAEIKVFEHKDAEHADALLRRARPGRRQLLITDGVFSMDGDIAPLPALVEVAERHGAIMMIDDAHASGVLGTGGAGTVDHFGLHGRVDVQVGTLSKAIGVLGGFIAGPARADRVAAEPRPALPVLDERAAGGRRRVHRGARHHPTTSPTGSSGCGRTPRRSRPACTSSGSTPVRARRRSRR